MLYGLFTTFISYLRDGSFIYFTRQRVGVYSVLPPGHSHPPGIAHKDRAYNLEIKSTL